MSEIVDRLKTYLSMHGQPVDFQSLTADASTREYFRIQWNGESSVACVYPTANDPAAESYLDVTRLFITGGLPVARIIDSDMSLGVIIQEDFGDQVLREYLNSAPADERERRFNEAISTIARIQVITPMAFEMGSVASKLKFDTEKLLWELNFFKTHYFETYLKKPLSAADDAILSAEFVELARELETYASVLCHRDFHAANLMLDREGKMRIIDHQDARIGSPAYDLVSLLLDRITELPSPEWLVDRRRYFLDVRRKFGLPKIDEDEFAYEFRLQTIQRCLKAAGTFSYQSVMRGKNYFIPFIIPMFRISVRGAISLGRFPAIRRILSREFD